MKRVVLLLVFVYSSFVVFGQFQVSGIVEDANGTSLIGANVILEGTYLGTSTGLSGKFVFSNVEKSYRTGIELQTAIKITDKMEWEVNTTLSRNKIKNFTEHVDNWDTWSQVSTNLGETDISFSPAIIMGSNFRINLFENFKIRMFSKYVSKQYIDNTSCESRILNPWFVNDLNFQYSFSQKWVDQISVKLQINNLFNEEYETNAWVYRYIVDGENKIMDGYFPQASRNFLVGLNFRF